MSDLCKNSVCMIIDGCLTNVSVEPGLESCQLLILKEFLWEPCPCMVREWVARLVVAKACVKRVTSKRHCRRKSSSRYGR